MGAPDVQNATRVRLGDDDADQAWATEIEKRARAVLDGSAELLDYDATMAELSALDNA